MAQVTVKLPRLHATQQRCVDMQRRFNLVVSGEDWGRTTLGIEALLEPAHGALKGKQLVAWFAADDEGVTEARRAVMRALGDLVKRRVNERRLELTTGGSIDFYSLAEVKGVFEQYHLIVVDDARRAPNLLDMWQDMLRPCLQQRKGRAWVLSGAYGKRNDLYRLWRMADNDPGWARWQFDTFANPHAGEELKTQADTVTQPEYRQRFGAEFLDVAFELSASQRIIAVDETFRQWCERLALEGLKVDGKPFKLDDRPAMAWIYDQIPSTREEAFRLVLVLMKCSQVGFTVMEILAAIYIGIKFGPATIGMFLPDTALADIKSSKRFMPVVRTIPAVHKLMTMDSADGTGKKSGEGNVRVRQIGEAMFMFSWTSGRATTESIPMDMLGLDEVQEMTLEQIEKTLERLSASDVRFVLMGSTANWPDADIHFWFKRGSQRRFHSKCPTCGVSKPLDDYFPGCIKLDRDLKIHRYVCPNGHWLEDPQHGEWVADNPEADPPIDYTIAKRDRPLRIRSIHFPQFLSPTISASEIMYAYNTASNMKNFFNRKLGKPYLDPTQVPVSLEHLAACVEAGKAAGVTWKSRAKGAYMGIDQMGNFNVVVIKERLPDGRQAVIHVEEIYSDDPFARCDDLMASYGIAACVLEINPNYNEAKRFANRHPGRVFICNSFGSLVEGMIAWGDAPRMDSSDKRTDEEERDRYTLRMDQYKCMQVSMSRFTHAKDGKPLPLCLFPDPQGLVQEVVEKGQREMTAVLPRVFHHFTKTALVAEKDDETNQYKRSVKKIGIDPHFSYANMLCDVAWARSFGTSTFMLADITPTARHPLEPKNIAPPPIIQELMDAAREGADDKCGNCHAFTSDSRICMERHFLVKAEDRGCEIYVRAA